MNTTLQKMGGTSLDISAENRAQLKQLFPSVFTETVNDKGELVESVDFEKLKAELGTFTDLFESRRERYGMDWPGKKEALKLIQTLSVATLKPCREESVNFDTTENLFIEGDNLEVLKLLQKSYYGKVKMIYIDPPYNTGKEFIYPDNYSESLETYLEYAGLIDGDGKKFSTNTANEGRFHTKWLNMMYPRLYLARNLLRDDGVIFISIDDNEVNNLRKMCDEIFGEENYKGTIVRSTGQTTGQDSGGLGSSFDYVITYSKKTDTELAGLPLSDSDLERYEEEDEKGKYALWQLRKTGSNDRRQDRPNMFFPIKDPDGNLVLPIGPTGYESRWRFDRKGYERLEKDNYIVWKIRKKNESKEWWPYVKTYLEGRTKRPSPLWTEIDGSKKASIDLRELMGNKVFDNPKPLQMIERLLQIVSESNKNSDIILDFFSGSCPTAHAVFDINKQDNRNRKFICVQLPEPCAEDTEAFKAGYKTISDIGKERIRRVIKKLNKEQEGKLDLEGASKQDLGFKVFKLDKSNFKQWQKLAPDAQPEKVIEQLELHIDHISHKATQEDLLYEILIKAGFTATEKIETKTMAGKQVFSIADGGLLICLENDINKELIDAVAEAEPMQFYCLDSAFHGNDQLKANAVQTFSARNMGREKANQIVFKTI
ncbi:MAG: site-specific DNA-methyltransferase [Proteobacteria bacterium]|nr:site-specific DNA-methyltransferase [Pseudomonadota bacterium]